jgi:hypothetical protein
MMSRCCAVVGLLVAFMWPDDAASQQLLLVRRLPPNRCDAIPAGPSPAAKHPEGIVLLRLRDELDAAQRLVDQLQEQRPTQRLPALQGERRRLIVLQREIDSVLAALARGDAGPLPLRSWGPQVSVRIQTMDRALREPAAEATGYLGLTLSGAQLRTLHPDGLYVSHCEPPVVEAVDPGSPAARAGVQAGDTLVAINGLELRDHAVSYPALLVPGTTLRLQLRRGGALQQRSALVAPRDRPPAPAPDDPEPSPTRR